MGRIDHGIVAVADLEAAAERWWREFGLEAQAGGVHAGLGTANRLVPVGDDQYVELLVALDPGASPVAARVAELAAEGDRVVGISVDPDDFEEAAARTGGAVPLERRSADGRVVFFRVAGSARAFGPELLPFFIEWGSGQVWRCGFEPPHHRVQPSGIRWVEAGGDADVVRAWLDDDSLPVRYVAGPSGVSAFAIGLEGGGEIVVR